MLTSLVIIFKYAIISIGDFMDKYGLGNFLAQLRNEKGITQEQLAEMINVNYKTISKWECGNSSPSLDILNQLCEIFDVSLYEMSIYKRIKNPLISKNDIKRIINKQSITKYIILKIILIILLVALIMFATYSGIYTINNYDQMHVYELSAKNNEISIDGIFVKFYNRYYLTISKMQYQDDNSKFISTKTKRLKYSVVINNEVFEKANISFNKETKIKDTLASIRIHVSNKKILNDIHDFYIKINYEINNGTEISDTFKIILNSKERNNKLFYWFSKLIR